MKHFLKIFLFGICFLTFTACNNQNQKEQMFKILIQHKFYVLKTEH